jgi:Spy/CpxP family protein refolding chaperone
MKTRMIAVLTALSLAAVSTAAMSHPGGGKGFFGGGPALGFGNEMKIEKMALHLDLDDTQRDTISNIVQAAKPEISAIRDELRANRQALASLDLSDPGFPVILEDIAASNGQLATEMTLVSFRVRSDIRAVLTDEQLDKLAAGRERMRDVARRHLDDQ